LFDEYLGSSKTPKRRPICRKLLGVNNIRFLDLDVLAHVQAEIQTPEACFGTAAQQSGKADQAGRTLAGSSLQAGKNLFFLGTGPLFVICHRTSFGIGEGLVFLTSRYSWETSAI